MQERESVSVGRFVFAARHHAARSGSCERFLRRVVGMGVRERSAGKIARAVLHRLQNAWPKCRGDRWASGQWLPMRNTYTAVESADREFTRAPGRWEP